MRKGSGAQAEYFGKEIKRVGHSKHNHKIVIGSIFEAICTSLEIQLSKVEYWHFFGLLSYIYSFSTYIRYLDIWKQLIQYCKKIYGITFGYEITKEMVHKFLDSKIDSGVALSTFKLYASALVKFQQALNVESSRLKRGLFFDFGLEPSSDLRKKAKSLLTRVVIDRAYQNALALVEHLNPRFLPFFILQYYYGFRLTEAITLKIENLIGNAQILIDNSKGGKERIITVDPAIYWALYRLMHLNGGRMLKPGEKIENIKSAYRRSLKTAAERSKQTYHGSHGLRWSWVQESFDRLLSEGILIKRVLRDLSHDLGHNRPGITCHYLNAAQKKRGYKPKEKPSQMPTREIIEKLNLMIDNKV